MTNAASCRTASGRLASLWMLPTAVRDAVADAVARAMKATARDWQRGLSESEPDMSSRLAARIQDRLAELDLRGDCPRVG